MRLHEIGPNPGATKPRTRRGRGPGSGLGKTAGRGHNGQKSRSGYSRRWGFEGGQMPLVRRVPKRGFHNLFRKEYAEINLSRLADVAANTEITPAWLVENGLIRPKEVGAVKLLGRGDLKAALKFQVHAVTKSAQAKVEAAGGSVQLIPNERKKFKPRRGAKKVAQKGN